MTLPLVLILRVKCAVSSVTVAEAVVCRQIHEKVALGHTFSETTLACIMAGWNSLDVVEGVWDAQGGYHWIWDYFQHWE